MVRTILPRHVRRITSSAASISVSSPAFHTQVCVIGAGVVGLAVARALALAGKEVLLVEKEGSIATETSSRNSEVIHAGLYYPTNSFKAKFCVQGKKQLYEYCEQRNLPFNRIGKLIVATSPEQINSDSSNSVSQLEVIKQKAILNGVDDVRLLSRQEVQVLEPELECFGALWSPSTGILDSHSYYTSLLADAEDYGTTLALSVAVQGAAIHPQPSSAEQPVGWNGLQLQFEDGTWLACDAVVNAAGLWAGKLAQQFHSAATSSSSSKLTQWKPPQYYYARGTYFQLQPSTSNKNSKPGNSTDTRNKSQTKKRRIPFSHLIYPVPEPGGLGVHATIDWGGQSVKFGPDVEWLHPDTDNPSQIDLTPNPERAKGFYKEVRKYWPDLTDDSLVADYVGIRPKLNHPDVGAVGFEDFRIVDESIHGVPGLIHLLGIESPGLTSSLAIADHVSSLLLKR